MSSGPEREIGRQGDLADLAPLGEREVGAPFDIPPELAADVDDSSGEVEVLFGETECFALAQP